MDGSRIFPDSHFTQWGNTYAERAYIFERVGKGAFVDELLAVHRLPLAAELHPGHLLTIVRIKERVSDLKFNYSQSAAQDYFATVLKEDPHFAKFADDESKMGEITVRLCNLSLVTNDEEFTTLVEMLADLVAEFP